MVAALEGLQDTSEFSEPYCASLADSSAPGCQLVEVFNSHGVFLPQLADEAGLSGNPCPKTIRITPTLHYRAPQVSCMPQAQEFSGGSLGCSSFLRGATQKGLVCPGGVIALSMHVEVYISMLVCTLLIQAWLTLS